MYGGTKEEAERLLSDAEKIAGYAEGSLDISNFSDMVDAIHIVQEELGITGTTADEASKTITGSVAAAKAAWENFLTGTMTGEEFVKTAFVAVDNVVNASKKLIPRIVTGIADMTPALLEKGTEIVQNVVTAIQGQLPTLLEQGTAFVENLGQGLITGIPNVVEKAMQLLENFTSFLASDGGTRLIQSGIDLITSLVTGLANALPVLVGYIPQIILNLVNAIVQNLPHLIDSGVKMIVAIIQGILNSVPQLIAQIPVIIQAIINLWKGTNWFSLGTTLIVAILNGIKSLINEIPNLVKSIGHNAMNVFKSIDWHSLGSNIIDGIVDGLKNGVSAVMDAAKSVAESALNAAKSFLGIHSPSRAFKEQVGYQSDAGQAEGMIENADLVEDAAREVSERALDASMSVNYDLPNTDTISKDIGASFTSRVMQTVNRVIEVPLNISGREVARATAWDMGEQLAWESR